MTAAGLQARAIRKDDHICRRDAGVPMPNANTHCPKHANATSCYILNTTTDTYANHKSNCAKQGGYLVSFNSAFEQLDVQTQLPALTPQSATSTWFWIGLEKAGSVWYWADGELHGPLVVPHLPVELRLAAAPRSLCPAQLLLPCWRF